MKGEATRGPGPGRCNSLRF